MQLYLDMDGVLADFDSGYERAFGRRPSKEADDVDWHAVRAMTGFYQHLPPMPDLPELWAHVERYRPIVLTGVPSLVQDAADDKRSWARAHLGVRVEVRCCLSKEKCFHAQPGDILVDDWEKYRALWLAKGGRWVTHTSASESIRALAALGVS